MAGIGSLGPSAWQVENSARRRQASRGRRFRNSFHLFEAAMTMQLGVGDPRISRRSDGE
jgi:hypothetical protein